MVWLLQKPCLDCSLSLDLDWATRRQNKLSLQRQCGFRGDMDVPWGGREAVLSK